MNALDHTFNVTILGSGTCVPSLERSSCSVLMEVDGCKLLFDAGVGTMHRLLSAETTINELSYIFFSHFHPDHSAELVPLLFATKYPQMERLAPLTIMGGRGFSGFIDRLKQVYGPWIELAPELLVFEELDQGAGYTRDFGAFSMQCSPAAHNPESTAYRITGRRGASVVYSGDTDFSEDLIELARGADVLICESAMPDDLKIPGHLTPSVAGEIAARAGVKRLVLTHFYPECESVDLEKQCRKTYKGDILIARDLMSIQMT